MTDTREPRRLFKDYGSLRDGTFEAQYRYIADAFQDLTEDLVLDLRTVLWFDLWSLIQLLFLTQARRESNGRVILSLFVPAEAANTQAAQRADTARPQLAAISFLVDMGFLREMARLGAEVWITQSVPYQERPVDVDYILRIIAELIAADDVNNLGHRIIPITRLADLRLDEKRDELFINAPAIFGQYHTEAIVQEAGLGDCLLQELVTNALEHGSTQGYVAMRAAPGIRRFSKTQPDKYEKAKKSRTHSSLGDWQTYFEANSDDAYFELVVADGGPGIAATIGNDVRLPDHLRECPTSPTETHARVAYALQTSSSRYPPLERLRMDRTDFTGLAAVRHVLRAHGGYLFIRERQSRHVFSSATTWNGEVFYHHRRTGKRLAEAWGLSLTAVVPMRRIYNQRPSYENRTPQHLPVRPAPEAIAKIVVFRVSPSRRSRTETALDRADGKPWRVIADEIRALTSTVSRVVLVDVRSASFEKNDFWGGLTRVYSAAIENKLALILCGLELRHVRRLEEYAELDRRKMSSGNEWLLLGWGDNAAVYIIGSFGRTAAEKEMQSYFLAQAFRTAESLDRPAAAALSQFHYLEWQHSDTYDAPTASAVASLDACREAIRFAQSSTLELLIRNSDAYVNDKAILLSDGEKVTSYVCIHSLSQMRNLYPDATRLAFLISCSFQFDYILAVGTGCRETAIALQRELRHRSPRTADRHPMWYTYHDYFSLRHGELAQPSIPKNARVLVLVDGVRNGNHAREVVFHVQDCSAVPVAIVSLLDLSEASSPTDIAGTELRCILRLPVTAAPNNATPDYIESPFSHTLAPAGKRRNKSVWETVLTRGQAYRYVDTHGLALCEHRTFYHQHFARTISLPYLLSSSTTLTAELVERVGAVIAEHKIDCILYPDQSSVGLLVDRIMAGPSGERRIATVMCRRGAWPDSTYGYDLDLAGAVQLKPARRVLIIEDEAYTGSSIKDLVTLCLTDVAKLTALVVFVVVDSMKHTERRTLSSLLTHAKGPGQKIEKGRTGAPHIRLMCFMRFALCMYWTHASCPLCRRSEHMETNLAQKPGVLEKRYAKERQECLAPQTMDQDYWMRPRGTRLHSPQTVCRSAEHEPIKLHSAEAFELFLEEAYVEGDVEWIVNRLCPSHLEFFPEPRLLLAALELLSRDLDLLLRLDLRDRFFSYVRAIFASGSLEGEDVAELLEILAFWPLHCLVKVWGWMLDDLFRRNSNKLPHAYAAAVFLLSEIEKRPPHPLKAHLQRDLDQAIANLESNRGDPRNASNYHLAMHLRRAGYSERPEYTSIAALVAETCFILGYSAKATHKTFLEGLDLLAKSGPFADAASLIYVAQSASHLLFALDSLAKHDSGAGAYAEHAGYPLLRTQIKRLQEILPQRGQIGRSPGVHEDVKQCSSHIMDLLYDDDNEGTRDSLSGRLRGYLESHSASLADILSRMATWANRLSGAIFDVGDVNTMSTASSVFVVLTASSVEEVFYRNLQSNLEHSFESWRKQQAFSQGTLWNDGDPFTVRLELDVSTLAWAKLRVLNSCSTDDRDSLRSGRRGTGLARIDGELARLGHRFSVGFNEELNMCEQVIELRRRDR